ncbi:hypothetical protein AGLY_000328 [Aphis glycines]|uniref:Uncharacterized protein n=1 Tax=Aphis glycines TaxID=307491 RepID=A0A6G0U988_APHGL|nr:hypothetical protein AGLY_000328 [Aphis glycines]
MHYFRQSQGTQALNECLKFIYNLLVALLIILCSHTFRLQLLFCTHVRNATISPAMGGHRGGRSRTKRASTSPAWVDRPKQTKRLCKSPASIEPTVKKGRQRSATASPVLDEESLSGQAHIEAKRLASLTSEATGKKYEQRLNLLKNIAHLWENDKIITTAQIDELNKMDDLQDVDVAACDFNNAVEHDLQDTSEVEECKIDDVKIDEVDELRDELPTLSLRIPKRGRPKGKDKTVIGVPKKRKLQSKLIPFEKLPINIRQFKILKCFVNEDVARTAVHDKILINENYIEMIPDKISNKIIDELVAIDEVLTK